MSKPLTRLFYKELNEQFMRYLDHLRTDPDTLWFFKEREKSFFFFMDHEINSMIVKLHDDLHEFDNVFKSFSHFGQQQLIQSYLMDELVATNEIENINTTRHDVMYLLEKCGKTDERKIRSIVNSYRLLFEDNESVKSGEDVAHVYHNLLEGAIDDKDKPDGILFRKEDVFITNGVSKVFSGFYPEEVVRECVSEIISFMNNTDYDLFERIILSHFLLETVHPFYDGNGRLGRYLMSLQLYRETGNCSAFIIAKAINLHRNKYYSAFEDARSFHEYGCLKGFFMDMAEILHEGYVNEIKELENKRTFIDKIEVPTEFTTNEKKIFKCLAEANLLTYYGLTNDEITSQLEISRRSIIYTCGKLKKLDMLEDIPFGKKTFHRLKNYHV